MISIVICSRTNTIHSSLYENIKNTIGSAYEFVIIDNSDNKYSIFEAYNIGIEKSVGEYICFIHDDVLFHTQNWGINIKEIFQSDNKIGLIGIAGAKVKTKMPSAWWDCEYEDKMLNIIQHFPDKKNERMNFGFENGNLQEAVIVDGVFMVMRKIEGLMFSEHLKGFHNYDLNICIEVIKRNFKVMVTNDILIEHFSLGNVNKEWVISSKKLYENYKNTLPLYINNSGYSKELEVRNGKKYVNLCYKHNIIELIKTVWFRLFLLKPFMKFHVRCFYTYIKFKLF